MKTTPKKGQKRSGRSASAKEQVPSPEPKVSPESREQLKELSRQVKHLVEEGKFATVNEAIVSTFYSDERNTDFRSFDQWKKDGFSVNKGEKAFLLWGKPKEYNGLKEDAEGQEVPNDYLYFPTSHLFSNAQVTAREKTTRKELATARGRNDDHDIDR